MITKFNDIKRPLNWFEPILIRIAQRQVNEEWVDFKQELVNWLTITNQYIYLETVKEPSKVIRLDQNEMNGKYRISPYAHQENTQT